jgi:pimeloyl-ACP methyl ester carboxylesterase
LSSITGSISGSSATRAKAQASVAVAYDSLLAAWNDFVDHDNDGRPIILIGHSQGSAVLIHLIAARLDHDSSVLRRLLVAILPGGNLQVPVNKTAGATFTHVPLCTGPTQTGCAIAYSTFPARPPLDALFGRPGQGVSLQSGQTARRGEQVACVNPAALGGGTADLSPLFLSATQTGLTPPVSTPWVSFPDLYSATCESQGGATWLQVSEVGGSGDPRPTIQATLGPTWGYHLDDVNLALGDLVHDVAIEEAAWTEAHPS